MYAFAEFTRQGHWSARACGECHEPLARDYNRHDRANRAGAGSWLRYDVPVACWGVARNAPFGRLGILPIKSDTSCMIGHRPAGSRLIAYLGRDIPHVSRSIITSCDDRDPEHPVRETDTELFGGEREISRFAVQGERDPEYINNCDREFLGCWKRSRGSEIRRQILGKSSKRSQPPMWNVRT